MADTNSKKKTVLVLAGHDPTGAAGIQADIETISANGCQCVSVITALTTQDTARCSRVYPQKLEPFREQCELLLQDVTVDACKIGLIGDYKLAEYIAGLLDELVQVPVVLDPVLAAGDGTAFADTALVQYIAGQLLKRSLVCTPNVSEARKLSGRNNITDAGKSLVDSGCPNVLITGADENTVEINNTLFQLNQPQTVYSWERIPGSFHGTGCTLAAAIAAGLASGKDISTAIMAAQKYTWQCLQHGIQYGTAQLHPNRLWNF